MGKKHIFTEKNMSERKEIRIKSVRPQIHEQLINISKNSGVSLSSLLKSHLPRIVESYPEKMKQPYVD